MLPAGRRFDAAGATSSSTMRADPAGSRTLFMPGVILKPKTLLSNLEQAGVSVEEFVNLLQWKASCVRTRLWWTQTPRGASP